jgi:hypothetical protein
MAWTKVGAGALPAVTKTGGNDDAARHIYRI